VTRLVRALRLVLVCGFTSYRALFSFLPPAVFVPTMIGMPVFQIVAFRLLGQYSGTHGSDFFVVGNAIQGCSLAGIYGASHVVANERAFATLSQVLITPASRVLVMLGRLLPAAVNGMFVAAVGLTAGWLFLGLRLTPATLLPVALAAVAGATSCAGIGLLLGALGLRFRDLHFVTNFVQLGLLVLTGAVIPLELLPGWLRPVSEAVPMTHAIRAAQAVVDHRPAGLGGALAAEFALAGVLFAAAVLLLRVTERQSRRHATLDLG
jgi:ABC-2 type transport system permease protein